MHDRHAYYLAIGSNDQRRYLSSLDAQQETWTSAQGEALPFSLGADVRRTYTTLMHTGRYSEVHVIQNNQETSII